MLDIGSNTAVQRLAKIEQDQTRYWFIYQCTKSFLTAKDTNQPDEYRGVQVVAQDSEEGRILIQIHKFFY